MNGQEDSRREKQAQAVAREVVEGSRVESETDYQAVLVGGGKINHLLHFLIGIFTCGFWWIVWIFLALTGGEKRYIVRTDEFGNARVEKSQNRTKAIIAVVLGSIALILVLAGIYGAVFGAEAAPAVSGDATAPAVSSNEATPTPTRTPAATPTPEPLPQLEVSATQVLDAYSANKFTADNLYKFADNGGQLLRVTGIVVSIEHEYVELSDGDWVIEDPFSNRVYGALASIYCYYDDASIRQHLNAGDNVALIGEGGGEPDFLVGFEMRGCRLAGDS